LKSVSLISDFGAGSFMLGSVKSRIMAHFPEVVFLDIEHNIQPYDSNEAAFILKQSYAHLPKKTVCLLLVDTSLRKNNHILVAKSNDRWFVSANNGILSILPRIDELFFSTSVNKKMSVKEAFTQTCIYLLNENWNEFSSISSEQMHQKLFLQPVRTVDRITGTVVYVDRYENVYTNIHEKELKMTEWKAFQIRLSRHELIQSISEDFDALPAGEIVAFFDDTGYLQIAINEGNAAGLLGLKKGSHIIIEAI
jgi:S-adenosylmethionine hydrolase